MEGMTTFAQAADRHLDDVYGYLVWFTGDRFVAEDLAAATFERALRLWHRFDPKRGSARTWLCQVARTVALDHFRSEKRRQRREQLAVERRLPREHDVHDHHRVARCDRLACNRARVADGELELLAGLLIARPRLPEARAHHVTQLLDLDEEHAIEALDERLAHGRLARARRSRDDDDLVHAASCDA